MCAIWRLMRIALGNGVCEGLLKDTKKKQTAKIGTSKSANRLLLYALNACRVCVCVVVGGLPGEQ